MDSAAYEPKLNELIAASKFEKKVSKRRTRISPSHFLCINRGMRLDGIGDEARAGRRKSRPVTPIFAPPDGRPLHRQCQ